MTQWDKLGNRAEGWARRRHAAGPPSSPMESQAATAPRSRARPSGRRAPIPNPTRPPSPLRAAAILCLPLPAPLLSCDPHAAAPDMVSSPVMKCTGWEEDTEEDTNEDAEEDVPLLFPHHSPGPLLPQLPPHHPTTSRQTPSPPASLKSGGVKGTLYFGEKPTQFGETGFEGGCIWGEMHPTWCVGSLTPKPCRLCGHRDRALVAGAGT